MVCKGEEERDQLLIDIKDGYYAEEEEDDKTLGKDLLGKLKTIFDTYFLKMNSESYRKKVKGEYQYLGCKFTLTLDEHVQAILLKK